MMHLRHLRARLGSRFFRAASLLQAWILRSEKAQPPARPPLCLEALEDRLPPGDLFGAAWTLGGLPTPSDRFAESVQVVTPSTRDLYDGPSVAPADTGTNDAPPPPLLSPENVDDAAAQPVSSGEGSTADPFTPNDPFAADSLDPTSAGGAFSVSLANATSSGYDGISSLPPVNLGAPNGSDGGAAATAPESFIRSPLVAAAPSQAPDANGDTAALQAAASAQPVPAAPTNAAVVAASFPAPAVQPSAPADGRGAPIANALVFQLQAGQEAAVNQLLPMLQAHHLSVSPAGIKGLYQLNGNPADLAAVQPVLSAQPAVRYVEAPRAVHIDLNPNDPQFNNGTLWGLNGTNGINAPAAWDVTTGSPATVIADIDTGIDYNHPDLYENIWINQAEIPASRLKNLTDVDNDGYISFYDLNNPVNQGPFKITDVNGDGRIDAADILAPMVLDSNGNDTGKGGWAYPGNTQDGDTAHPNDFIGWNFVNNTNNPFDDNSHGTHTAGTIAAIGNNGIGVTGVNWQASIMALKFLDASGSGTDVGAAAAIAYSVAHGARISNNSWGGGGSQTLYNAIDAARTADFGNGRIGQVFVAAAGNNGQNSDTNPSYPGAYNLANIISVAATNTDGGLASFSNYGPTTIKVGAPGVNIYSTVPGGGYGYKSGTSMATPHVTGVVGLVLTQNPNLTAVQVVNRIVSTVTPDSYLAGKTVSGGIVNAANAVTVSPPPTPTGLAASAIGANAIQLSWNDVTGASGFKIERSPNGSSGWVQVGTTDIHQTIWQNATLTASTTYYYRVRATNSAGDSGYSSVVSATTPSGGTPTLFTDGFDGATLNSAWSTKGGTWTQAGGVLSQTSSANADPRKALVAGQASSGNLEITAKVRVDSWTDGDYARAGVGLRTDPTTGMGYNLVFHYTKGTRNNVQFLNDGVVWGNAYSFNWNPGTWYWFKMKIENGVLYGKVWQDGTTEPSTWAFTQSGWTGRSTGAPALNGGSALFGGNATVSFDDVIIQDPTIQTSVPPAPTGLTAASVSSSQINLTWNDVSGETGFKVERSPNGTSGWTQIGTTGGGVTTFSDSGLSASTTYYYRVRATNNVGDGPYSAVVSATTQPAVTVLFSDNFPGSTLSSAWTTDGGTWSPNNGVLSQTSTADADPRKAMVTSPSFPADVEITAKVRVDSWTDGDYARAGVGLNTDPGTALGYNLVFHYTNGSRNNVQFLDDGVTWGNAYSFNWNLNTWYWFKLKVVNGVLYGKVWQDGTPEPTTWAFTQGGWTDHSSGAPALNGGSALNGIGGSGNATVSFANVLVTTPQA